MLSQYKRMVFPALGVFIVAFGACTYELPSIEPTPNEASGAGGANSVSSSSSGFGGQTAGSSSGQGGSPPVSSSSSGIPDSSSSSSGEPQGSSSSSSSSSGTSMGMGTIQCGGTACVLMPPSSGCCFTGNSGTGTLTCTDQTTCGTNTMFYCDGIEDCPNEIPCCLIGNVATCNTACAGAYVCNDDGDCMGRPNSTCIKDFYGTIGQCQP